MSSRSKCLKQAKRIASKKQPLELDSGFYIHVHSCRWMHTYLLVSHTHRVREEEEERKGKKSREQVGEGGREGQRERRKGEGGEGRKDVRTDEQTEGSVLSIYSNRTFLHCHSIHHHLYFLNSFLCAQRQFWRQCRKKKAIASFREEKLKMNTAIIFLSMTLLGNYS